MKLKIPNAKTLRAKIFFTVKIIINACTLLRNIISVIFQIKISFIIQILNPDY